MVLATPTISYGHLVLYDNYSSAQWDIANHLNGATAVFANTYDDNIDFYVSAGVTATTFIHTSTDGTAETDWGYSSTLYKHLRYRYKVTVNARAKITIMLHTAGEVTVLADGGNQDYHTATFDIPTGDYIDSIRIYNHTGVGSVIVDFVSIYKDDFTLPNVAHGASFTPPPRYADQGAPMRITDVTQGMGGESATFDCSSDLDVGTWKRTLDTVDAQVIYEIAHELGSTADFVWLDTGEEQFKATMRKPMINRYGDHRTLDLEFKEYSRCNASHYTYIERFGLNL
jgi:hypothetical protein